MRFIKFLLSKKCREDMTHEFIGIYNESNRQIEVAIENSEIKRNR